MGPSRRTTQSPHAAAEPPPPRRWGRGLLWLGAILVLVGVAVAATVLVADPHDDEMNTAPLAADQFCTEAAAFRSFSELNLEEDGAERLRDQATSARRLASLAPPTVAADLDAVAAAFDSVANAVEQVPPEEPDRLAIVTQRLDDELTGVQDQADRAGAYVDKWCGAPDTTTATADPPG